MANRPSDITAMAAFAEDAFGTLRAISIRAARMVASGNEDPRLRDLAAIVAFSGPSCPKCGCHLIGTSPAPCHGCGAHVAWSISTSIARK